MLCSGGDFAQADDMNLTPTCVIAARIVPINKDDYYICGAACVDEILLAQQSDFTFKVCYSSNPSAYSKVLQDTSST